MFKPAHKQDDPAKAPGQVVNDITLSDYITRKNYHEAFDKVAEEKGLKKKKLKFDEWFKESATSACYGLIVSGLTFEEWLYSAWNAAQDNV